MRSQASVSLWNRSHSATPPELWIERAELAVGADGEANRELAGTLRVVLVQQVVERLVQPLAVDQHHPSPSGHTSLHNLDIYDHLSPRDQRMGAGDGGRVADQVVREPGE